MAGGISSGDPDQPLAEINVTPLVDVMLVLLVIFIVAAPLMAQALKVDLPRVQAQAMEVEPDIVDMAILPGGGMELDGRPLGADALRQELAVRAKASPDLVVRLAGDTEASYGAVAEALGLARQAGIRRIAFSTRQP